MSTKVAGVLLLILAFPVRRMSLERSRRSGEEKLISFSFRKMRKSFRRAEREEREGMGRKGREGGWKRTRTEKELTLEKSEFR